MMTIAPERPDTRPIDIAQIRRLLLGQWIGDRLAAREFATDPRLEGIAGMPRDDHRRRVLEGLRILAADGIMAKAFPVDYGGRGDPGGSIATFEEFVLADPSLVIKSGVQWGLFTSAIYQLGTESHHERYLHDAITLSTPGVFAMTETGHGSDVSAIGTTATYDQATDSFDLHTPFRGAWKDYLGNAALHGRAAVVFAQLIVAGVNHGVHALYVPIRDAEGHFLPGVGGEDDGFKGGLNGIDNGRLHFTHVKVPRIDLLDRFGHVEPDGTYSSPIASPGRRFFTMISTLVQGRVSLDGAANLVSQAALRIAIRYAQQRRQFSAATPFTEAKLLDYQEHQRRLLPLLAITYAGRFAHEELLTEFHEVFSATDPADEARQDLETTAAVLKALGTWHALDTLQATREACGGAGFLAENRLALWRSDLDIFVTFEGDNTVLLQLVGKRLLADYSKEFAHLDAGGVARYIADWAADVALHRLPLRRMGQLVADSGSARRAAGALRDTDTQRALLTDRAETMVADLANALRPALKAAPPRAAEIVGAHQHEMIETARAYGELLQWEAFTRATSQISDDETREVLTRLRNLFGMTLLDRHLAWYLINGRMAAPRARTVGSYIDRLLAKLAPHADALTEAFGLGQASLRAAIATDAEELRQQEAADYYRRERAGHSAPIPEKRRH